MLRFRHSERIVLFVNVMIGRSDGEVFFREASSLRLLVALARRVFIGDISGDEKGSFVECDVSLSQLLFRSIGSS